ncbi:hypothetical protein NM208_g8825 [Fusarium decemcellulare]|uniref:Uncharacterized protein n=1 Tax=Fusarium decemcellulare TaxID=57161 RepID=A0ACC1S433_9HYPO|nr:hypothetical protein NM208_g8825 [Fusarium decemcellulare]
MLLAALSTNIQYSREALQVPAGLYPATHTENPPADDELSVEFSTSLSSTHATTSRQTVERKTTSETQHETHTDNVISPTSYKEESNAKTLHSRTKHTDKNDTRALGETDSNTTCRMSLKTFELMGGTPMA